jgi:hypothetical protein
MVLISLAMLFLAQPTLGRDKIATKHRRDAGIQNDPAVNFSEHFDEGIDRRNR